MKYAFMLMSWLVMSAGTFAFWYLYGILNSNVKVPEQLKRYRTNKRNQKDTVTVKQGNLFIIVSTVLLLGHSVWLWYSNVHILDWLKLSLMMWFLVVLAIIDWRYHIIPNKILILALVLRLVIYAMEYVFRREVAIQILISSILGFLLGFGLLFIMALLTRHALGYGDVKLFGVIGLYMGLVPVYNVLLYGLVASSLAGMFLLVIRKKGRKYQIPFGPFVLIGYMVVVICGMY